MSKDTLTEVYRTLIVIVPADGGIATSHHFDIANSAELEEAIHVARRSLGARAEQHMTLFVGKFEPITLVPGRPSNALQGMYRTLRLRSFEV